MFRKSWPIKVVIFNKRTKGGIKVETGRAQRRTTKEGEISYVLKKGKKVIPPVLYEHITNDNFLFLYCDKTESYAPMEIKEPKGVKKGEGTATLKTLDKIKYVRPIEIIPAQIVGIDISVKNWMINSVKKGFKLWQDPSFFARYGHFLATVAVLIAIGVMIYISLEKIIALDQLSVGAMERLSQILSKTGGQPTTW